MLIEGREVSHGGVADDVSRVPPFHAQPGASSSNGEGCLSSSPGEDDGPGEGGFTRRPPATSQPSLSLLRTFSPVLPQTCLIGRNYAPPLLPPQKNIPLSTSK
ncbi:hypothetical protein DPEC_G00110900 [Dallia pectoralis]|uniref:Uncharacterized protein n=1 Tax=Dallia pectoralis TaxID=75939 RepID=A0ACC2GSR9_DALPE|nr:hypothetical protein DPEC_G00110900 [Dallia pectoralis]